MKKIFVIPAYNEEKNIGRTLENLKKIEAEFIVVNDGSSDRTNEIALKKGATVCSHLINRGLGASLATGIEAALEKGADIVITFDADLQHSSNDIDRLIEPILKGEADAVIGSRFLKKEDSAEMPFVKVIGNEFLTFTTNLFSRAKITDSQSGLRALNRKSAETLLILCDRYEVSSEIIYELSKNNMRIKEAPVKAIYNEENKGTTIRSGIDILFGVILKKIKVKK